LLRLAPHHTLSCPTQYCLVPPLLLATLQTHEEVLRLLLAAAPRLDAMQLSNYLTRTLNSSK
jgi:hypothetical protein